MLHFFLNFEPDIPTTTHQVGLRAGTNKKGKAYLYKDRSYENLEALYDSKLLQFVPSVMFGRDTQLRTMWVFSSGKDDGEPSFRNDKPDTDNLVKLLKDRMTKCGFWKDDSCVVRETIEKLNAPSSMKHGVYVWISTITTGQETATAASTSDSPSRKSGRGPSEDAERR